MAKTTTQQIDTTTADADAYLRGNKNEAYVDLKKTVDLCDQALKGATDPAQKKALDHELKVRQAAIKKFENLYSRAVYHGYAQDLDSSTFAQLAEHVQGKGENVDGYGKGAGFANFLTDGKPVNKKAIGLGTALGATSIIAAIVKKTAGVDLTAWLVGTAVPEAAKFVFSNMLVPMFQLSPTFAIGAIAFTALAVPLITKFLKGKVQKLNTQRKINKATAQAAQDNANFAALKGNVSQLSQDQIRNMTFLSDAQRQELLDARTAHEAQETKKENENRAVRRQDPANFKRDDLKTQGFNDPEIDTLQAKNAIANDAAGMETAITAYNKMNAANLLKAHTDLLEPQNGATGAEIDNAIFNGQSFSQLLATIDLTAEPAQITQRKSEIMKQIAGVVTDAKQQRKYISYLQNYEQIREALTVVATDRAAGKDIATIATDSATALETATQSLGFSFGNYTATPSGQNQSTQEQTNKQVARILAEAAKLSQAEKDALVKDHFDHQFGA